MKGIGYMDHDQNEMTLVPADSPLLMENTTVEGEPTYAPTDHHRAASGPSPPVYLSSCSARIKEIIRPTSARLRIVLRFGLKRTSLKSSLRSVSIRGIALVITFTKKTPQKYNKCKKFKKNNNKQNVIEY